MPLPKTHVTLRLKTRLYIDPAKLDPFEVPDAARAPAGIRTIGTRIIGNTIEDISGARERINREAILTTSMHEC